MTNVKLLITSDCQYCTTMMSLLGELLKEGKISRLLMINITEQPEEAARYNVRSVPWLKIGEMVFTGAQSRAELEKAIEMSVSRDGQQSYLIELLKNGELSQLSDIVGKNEVLLPDILELMKIKNLPMSVRIGVSAIVEGLQEKKPALERIQPIVLELSTFHDETIRADACHFLSMIGGELAIARLKECMKDSSKMVREVATESVESLLQP